jgi:hypothetical protein
MNEVIVSYHIEIQANITGNTIQTDEHSINNPDRKNMTQKASENSPRGFIGLFEMCTQDYFATTVFDLMKYFK